MKRVSRKLGMRKRSSIGLVALLLALTAVFPLTAAQNGKGNAVSRGALTGGPTVAPGPTYIISPDDVLDVSVWQQPNLSFRALPVRPDGKISLPLINDVQAAGLTAMQLAASIKQQLKQYVKDPVVTVVVAQVNSQRYYVLGEVLHAGVFPLLPGLRVLQALSAAGGFTQFANQKKIYVLRTVSGRQHKFPFNYKAVINGQDLIENMRLKPGDTIIVP
jgi:polysaccharide biosynthesis/export protein